MSLISRLRERKVIRMAIIYFVLAWGILQVVDIAAGLLELPDWSLRATFALLVLFFPIALALSWIFRLSPQGLERESEEFNESCGEIIARPANLTHASIGNALDGRRAVAVLPFRSTDMLAADDYMADGLTEEILNSLARIKALRVPCRSSWLSFKKAECDARQTAERLSVDHILEGTVSGTTQNVTVSAKLLDTKNNSVLWSCSRNFQPDELSMIDQDISRGVAGALDVDLEAEDDDRTAAGRLTSSDAYLAYLKGRHAMQDGTGHGCRKAVSYFEDTIELDDDYPRAWSGLSLAYTWLARYGLVRPEAGFSRARDAALRALELDENLAEAHLALAQVQLSHEWDFVAAEASLLRALELDPDSADANSRYGHFLGMFGRMEPAIQARERALIMEPLSEEAHLGLADTLFLSGRYDEALNRIQRLRELSPDFPTEHLRARIALKMGRPKDALDTIERETLEWRRLYISAIARFRLGDFTAAKQLLEELIGDYGDDAALQVAIVYTQMGEHDQAFNWLQTALENRDPGFVELQADPELAPLRSDPRLARLVQKANLNSVN